jgi:hypothetical protein
LINSPSKPDAVAISIAFRVSSLPRSQLIPIKIGIAQISRSAKKWQAVMQKDLGALLRSATKTMSG